MMDLLPAPAFHLFESSPGVIVPAVVVPEDVTLMIGHPSQLWDRVGERAELLLTRLGFSACRLFPHVSSRVVHSLHRLRQELVHGSVEPEVHLVDQGCHEVVHLVQRQGLPLTMSGVDEVVQVIARLGELEEVPQLVRVVYTRSIVASEIVAKG
jgi:hypothetical protein